LVNVRVGADTVPGASEKGLIASTYPSCTLVADGMIISRRLLDYSILVCLRFP
jgi:hypothetical protein